MSQRTQSKRIQYGWAASIKSRDGYRCQHCGTSEKLQAHHIVPLSQGGKNTLANGITLCGECHRLEHLDETHKHQRGR